MIKSIMLEKRNITTKTYYALTGKTFVRVLNIKYFFQGKSSKRVFSNTHTMITGDYLLFSGLCYIGRL